jgi:hypothetical protein
MFARVEENGGFFVSRIKKNMNPVVASIEEGVHKTKCEEFIGKTYPLQVKRKTLIFN